MVIIHVLSILYLNWIMYIAVKKVHKTFKFEDRTFLSLQSF